MNPQDCWIQTMEGIFHPLQPVVEEIHIKDIGRALAHICRYTGHVSGFYSVAEHSVIMATQTGLTTQDLKMWALLHDAPEAYISDLNQPLKQALPEYRDIENGIMAKVSKKFNLEPSIMPMIIKNIDRRMCQDEREVLLPPCDKDWGVGPLDRLGVQIEQWDPAYSYAMFMETYYRLGGKD